MSDSKGAKEGPEGDEESDASGTPAVETDGSGSGTEPVKAADGSGAASGAAVEPPSGAEGKGTKAAACKFINDTLKSLQTLSTESCGEAAAAAPGATAPGAAASEGGRRGKRSVRKGSRGSKSRRGNRSRKGGKSRGHKGSKGRKSRGRTNKRKGGAKMGKELKAWMKRQKAATGIDPISKATIAATKTKPQATGSDQRLESGKHVAAQARGFGL